MIRALFQVRDSVGGGRRRGMMEAGASSVGGRVEAGGALDEGAAGHAGGVVAPGGGGEHGGFLQDYRKTILSTGVWWHLEERRGVNNICKDI